MTHEELITLIDSIETDTKEVAEALAFIRLVVKNNPKKTPAQIMQRPDIQEALGVIDGWLRKAREAVEAVAAELPAEAVEIATGAATETLDKLETDTRIEDRIGEWQASDEPPESWAAKIVLRMQWFIDWLRSMVEWIALGAPYKRWVSRLDEKTCKFCRGLHGAVLPVGASFAIEAAKVGFTRIYGGLFAPPLHPNCRCTLRPVSQARYNQLTAQAG